MKTVIRRMKNILKSFEKMEVIPHGCTQVELKHEKTYFTDHNKIEEVT